MISKRQIIADTHYYKNSSIQYMTLRQNKKKEDKRKTIKNKNKIGRNDMQTCKTILKYFPEDSTSCRIIVDLYL